MLSLLTLVFGAGLLGSGGAVVRSAEGSPANITDFSSIVQVDFLGVSTGTWTQSCAGSVLNAYFILSSAYCFSGITYDSSNRRIRAGTAYRNTGGIVTGVLREYNHPSYGLVGNDGDISVVRLTNSLIYSDSIARAVIINQGAEFYGGLPVLHAGWGATIQGGTASPILLKTDLYTIDRGFCKERYEGLSIPEPVTNNMTCFGFPRPVDYQSACLGDFGGPLYYVDQEIGNIVIGLVSWGFGCSNSSFPGVATSVGPYSDWVVSMAR